MTPEEYEDHFRRLAVVAYRMGELVDELRESHRQHEATIEELREFTRQQVVLNERQAEFNADVKTTLAGIQTLLDHVLRGGANGRQT